MTTARRGRRSNADQGQLFAAPPSARTPSTAELLTLLKQPVPGTWDTWTSPTSLREVEAEVNLILDDRDPSTRSAPSFRAAEMVGTARLQPTNEDDLQDTDVDALSAEMAE